MGWFDWFRPRPKPPTPTPPAEQKLKIVVEVKSDAGARIEGVTIAGTLSSETGGVAWSHAGTPISYYQLQFELPVHAGYGNRGHLTVKVEPGYSPYDEEVTFAANMIAMVRPAKPAIVTRSGDVVATGNAWSDAGGPWYPAASTMLWAVGGWKRGDIARVEQWWDWFREHKFDTFRGLCQTNWSGEDFDVTNDPNLLADVIDAAYERGLRMKPTLIGGGCKDPIRLAETVRDVIAGRRHKVLFAEMVNENNVDRATAIQMARIVQQSGVLVSVGFGNQGNTFVKEANDEAGASVDVLHTERTLPDLARQVRQCWDFHVFPRLADCGEPPGPASSGQEMTDPYGIASLRLGSIVCGAGSVCLHTGTGVFGRAHTTNDGRFHRQDNIWEVPNIDAMTTAFMNAVSRLPLGVDNWTSFNVGFPVDVPAGNVNKIYGARWGQAFVEIVIGANGAVTLVGNGVHFNVWNIATGAQVGTSDSNYRSTVNGLFAYLVTAR